MLIISIWPISSKNVSALLDSGTFVELETVYKQETNELIVQSSNFGEFIFGIPAKEQNPLKPSLFLPENDEIVNQNNPLTLKWSTHGYFRECNLQVAKDNNFENIVIDEILNPTLFTIEKLEPQTEYFWRVKSINEYGESDWSDFRTFKTQEAYIEINNPKDGDIWEKDSKRRIIKWKSNTSDAVKIELLKDDLLETTISDSIVSFTGAYSWIIPEGIVPDTTYKIRITLLKDNSVASTSNIFTIKGDPSSVNDRMKSESDLSIKNYPNPFSNSTIFDYFTAKEGFVEINLFDLKGNLIATIFKGFSNAGSHSINWSNSGLESGTYYYEIRNDNLIKTGKLIINH